MNTTGTPENGVRFELLLSSLEGGVAHYEGHAFLPSVSIPISIRTSAAQATTEIGAPSAPIEPERLAAIEKLGTTLVRAATRVELQKGDPIPGKIVRWRPFDS